MRAHPTEPTEPTDPATVAPAAPAAGQSLDLMKIGETAQTTQATVQAMTDPASADFDADLANILKLMSAAGPAAQSLLQRLRMRSCRQAPSPSRQMACPKSASRLLTASSLTTRRTV
ncbi:hypothetical protein [Deinococcus ficus]|uniref:hypothetical protein n=1 Tax=Deinococcus ficus TaxID=317577 RepID=UPI00040297B7|nr:hypothetical protein [Deinococcus ficus]